MEDLIDFTYTKNKRIDYRDKRLCQGLNKNPFTGNPEHCKNIATYNFDVSNFTLTYIVGLELKPGSNCCHFCDQHATEIADFLKKFARDNILDPLRYNAVESIIKYMTLESLARAGLSSEDLYAVDSDYRKMVHDSYGFSDGRRKRKKKKKRSKSKRRY